MRTTCALLLLSLASLGAAQSAPKKPFMFEIGAYFPAYRGADYGKDIGVAGALGYAFLEKDDFSGNVQLRSAFHAAFSGGGEENDNNQNLATDFDLTITSAFLNLRHQHHGTGLFTGVGIGVGRAELDGGNDHTNLLFAAEIGYSLSPQVYLLGRYQTANADAFRGTTVGLGFRF